MREWTRMECRHCAKSTLSLIGASALLSLLPIRALAEFAPYGILVVGGTLLWGQHSQRSKVS